MQNKQQLKLINFVNKDFYSSSIPIDKINHSKQVLRELLGVLDPKESEEHNKNLIRDFLIQMGYKFGQVNTSRRIDLSISNNGYNNVIIETKDFGNPQMLTTKDINRKAIHELILYFMREYLVHHNQHVTYLIATNGVEWFIFEASEFKKLFINDKKFVKEFEDSDVQKSLTDTSTTNFYRHIAKPKVAKVINKIHYLHFDWSKEFHGQAISDELATNVYKLFNPVTMFKETFVSDSNALNVNFYNELLYIMGLHEKRQSKGIERLPKGQRQRGSLVELIYYAISSDSVAKSPQRVFDDVINMAMSFIDRLLFLKLLEGQLIKFNGNNKKYSFLNNKKIQSFSDVDDLFFKVLAVPRKNRVDFLKEKYPYIPYLNSSLFEKTPIEKEYHMSPIRLRNTFQLPLFKHSVLKGRVSKNIKGEKTLTYLIDFLNSYSFNANGRSFNNQELINSSVLGSIFEKINGYKDGSYFTPGFVTSYMARTSIHKALINKFNRDGFHIHRLLDLLRYDHNKVKNELNSFHLVDPAVGSGHFLVSALNYLVKVYNDLGLLTPHLMQYNVSIKNDELRIDNSALHKAFHYIRGSDVSTDIQKSIFNAKRSIIENNLFGVDLNPNSVNITKLRLWIELLKNSYYEGSNLVTMPNLEMNIKAGNSIINRYTLDEPFSNVSSGTGIKVRDFKKLVNDYKNTSNKQVKHKMGHAIHKFKENIINAINDLNARSDLKKAYQNFNSAKGSIELISSKSIQRSRKRAIVKTRKNLTKAKNRWNLLNDNRVFHGSFEWRFEFPELLNDKGDFIGFDLVIANPPYIKMDNHKPLFDQVKKSVLGRYANKRMDLFYYFFYLSIALLTNGGVLGFITTNYWLTDDGAELLRNTFKEKLNMLRLINFNNFKIFSSALGQHNMITEAEKSNHKSNVWIVNTKENGNAISHISTFNKIVNGKDHNTTYTQFSNKNLYDSRSKNIINLTAGTDKTLDNIVDRLSEYDTLSNHISSSKGITASPNGAFILSKQQLNNIKDELTQREKSLIYPLINGSQIKGFNEPINHSYIIYTTKKTDIKRFPYINKYIHSHIFNGKYDHNPSQRKQIRLHYYYALRWPRVLPTMLNSDTLFAPGRSVKPYFVLNQRKELIKDDSYEVYPKSKNSNVNMKAVCVLLNSTLARFLWLYHRIVNGSMILIKKLSFSVLPFTQEMCKNSNNINGIVDKIKTNTNSKDIQNDIDKIVNHWFGISDYEYKHMVKFINDNQ